jgi:hypothetical protein
MENVTPEQYTGRAINARSSRKFSDQSAATQFFQIVKQRLENVNSWQAIANEVMARFVIVNSEGDEVHRPPIQGDHFKIDIPGPGTQEGEGYDWVRIETIYSQSDNDSENYGFTVRPSSNPRKSSTETAHFYSVESTSTFIARRDKRTVTAEVHDRNTKPNPNAERTTDKIRNKMVGAIGAVLFSKVQWQNLTDGLISD